MIHGVGPAMRDAPAPRLATLYRNIGGGPALIDEAPFAATHSHDRTDFLHSNNPVTEWDNPLGLDGFDLVEFTGPDKAALANLFSAIVVAHPPTPRTNISPTQRGGYERCSYMSS